MSTCNVVRDRSDDCRHHRVFDRSCFLPLHRSRCRRSPVVLHETRSERRRRQQQVPNDQSGLSINFRH